MALAHAHGAVRAASPLGGVSGAIEICCTYPLEFTKKLLDLKAEMDEMVAEPFNNDMKF